MQNTLPFQSPSRCALLALSLVPLAPLASMGSEQPGPVVEVTRTDLSAETGFEARFDAVRSQEIRIDPADWKEWVVLRAVPHGTTVRKGDVLVEFDQQDIGEEIDTLERARAESATGLELAQAELDHQRTSTPMELESASRAARRAKEDLERFQSEGRARAEAEARFSLVSAEQQLLNEREELEQLLKMYEADDLTEETEEIILQRQKFAVEAAEFSFAGAQLRVQERLAETIPREAVDLESAQQQTALALELAEDTLERKLRQKELAVAKLETDRRKEATRLSDLQKDRQAMTLTAPFDGIAFYGAFRDGRLVSAAEAAKKLAPGGKVAPFEVVMTVVEPSPLELCASVDEKVLGQLREGTAGTATPALLPDARLPVKVTSLGAVPDPDGSYPVRLEVEAGDHPNLRPGMTCKVDLQPVLRSGVLAIPEGLVSTEAGKSTVRLQLPDGSEEDRTVQLGARGNGMIEVLDGLAEGDRILPRSGAKPER
jgi:multidrug efflux pump subunit AcrA (membrane-fusion protein)